MLTNDRVEILILVSLLTNEGYTRKVLPILDEEFFHDEAERTIFAAIKEFVSKYNVLPTKEAILINVTNKAINQKLYEEITEIVNGLKTDEPVNESFLLEHTEQFAREKAYHNALRKSVALLEGANKTKYDFSMSMKYMQDALAVTIDPNVGHSYITDWEKRFDSMHRHVEKIPFDLQYLNKITKGGVERKTLNVILAGTGVGKTLAMCHLAAAAFMEGKKVLYITLEMSEEKILERIDANLMNISLDDLQKIPRELWEKKIETVKSKSIGAIQVKEYPTAQAGINHFRHLLTELQLKSKFIPDIIFVDYLNIAASARIKLGSNVNSYQYVKSVAEELRGLAQEYNLPVWTATQTNRAGFNSTDVGLENTSESFGVPMTADFLIALTRTEELDKLGQIVVTQLKNRYGDLAYYRRFIVGVDRSKMRLYDVEQKAQEGLVDAGHEKDKDDKPGFDNSPFGAAMSSRGDKKDFASINFDDTGDDDDEDGPI